MHGRLGNHGGEPPRGLLHTKRGKLHNEGETRARAWGVCICAVEKLEGACGANVNLGWGRAEGQNHRKEA